MEPVVPGGGCQGPLLVLPLSSHQCQVASLPEIKEQTKLGHEILVFSLHRNMGLLYLIKYLVTNLGLYLCWLVCPSVTQALRFCRSFVSVFHLMKIQIDLHCPPFGCGVTCSLCHEKMTVFRSGIRK